MQVLNTNNYVTVDGTIHHNSGKSSACVIKILEHGLRAPPMPDGVRRTRWAVIRNTYGELKDTTMRTFFDWLPPVHFGTYHKSDHNYLIDRLQPDLEIEILFRALDRPEHAAKLLSLELTAAWINEAREVPWAIVKPLMGRLKRFPAASILQPWEPVLMMDTNPPDTSSWWYELFEEKKPKNAIIYKQPGGLTDKAENLTNLAHGYYDELVDFYDEDERVVYIDGAYGFIKSGKPVYPGYRDTLHCRTSPPVPGIGILRCWDFGLTPACIFLQLLPSGRIQAIDELCADRAGVKQFSDLVAKYSKATYPQYEFDDVGDPSGDFSSQTDEADCFDMMAASGINCLPGNQSTELRYGSVKYALDQLVQGEPMFTIDPKCKVLRKGFQGEYKYRKLLTSEDKWKEKPEKNEYSHPHDALQYGMVELLGDVVKASTSAPVNIFDDRHTQQTEQISDFDAFNV